MSFETFGDAARRGGEGLINGMYAGISGAVNHYPIVTLELRNGILSGGSLPEWQNSFKGVKGGLVLAGGNMAVT